MIIGQTPHIQPQGSARSGPVNSAVPAAVPGTVPNTEKPPVATPARQDPRGRSPDPQDAPSRAAPPPAAAPPASRGLLSFSNGALETLQGEAEGKPDVKEDPSSRAPKPQSDPRSDKAPEAPRENGDKAQLSEDEEKIVKELARTDREVRNHERAHAAAGGAIAGAPSYQYRQGPDGKRYAVNGEVSIDISPVSGDPAATIAKMQKVKAAAGAPAQPSGQDRAVSAAAEGISRQAQAELRAQTLEKSEAASEPEKAPEVARTPEPEKTPEAAQGPEPTKTPEATKTPDVAQTPEPARTSAAQSSPPAEPQVGNNEARQSAPNHTPDHTPVRADEDRPNPPAAAPASPPGQPRRDIPVGSFTDIAV